MEKIRPDLSTDRIPIADKLSLFSVEQSLNFVKSNLNSLGVKHDKFVRETDIINNKEVDKVVDFLKNRDKY